MSLKSKIPIPVLQDLEKALKEEMDHFQLIETGQGSFKILERDSNSEFYFTFNEIIHSAGKISYKLAIFPYDNFLRKGTPTVGGTQISGLLSSWISRVNILRSPSFLFDDEPIINNYMEEQAEIIFDSQDELVDNTYFSLQDQLRLHSIYDKIIEDVLRDKEEPLSPEAAILVEQLKENQSSIGKDTKGQTRTKLNRVLAFGRKFSLDTFQKMLVRFAADELPNIISKAGKVVEWISIIGA